MSVSVLKQKIKDRTVTLGVVGLGYVGLPLAVEKAKAGFNVIGFDVQEEKVDMVNRGHNYIGDVVNHDLEEIVRSGGADCFLVENGRLNQYMEDNRYRCVFLTQPQELSFAVRRDNPVLLAILNKTLKTMQSSMLTGALSLYDSSAQRVTLATPDGSGVVVLIG